MVSELEELVDFLGSPRSQIRQIALDHLVGYTMGPQSSVFKSDGLKPIKNLKVIVNDIAPRAKNALTMLVNLSDDKAVLEELAMDDAFLELLLSKITDPEYPNADLVAMLLANLAKSDDIQRILYLKRAVPTKGNVSTSSNAMDQLMDCFVKGVEKGLNKEADFDFLAYFFADISRLSQGRKYFITKQPYDGVIPISKIIVFTEHKSVIRRKGVASTIKNSCFDVPSHKAFLNEDEVNLLSYVLLPLCGPEEFDEDDMLDMLPDLQLLPPDKQRESDMSIIVTHLETLLLLTTTREAREYLRKVNVYLVVKVTHLAVDDEDVQDACDRLVQVLMRDEEAEEMGERVKKVNNDDDDEVVVEIL
ncbi:Protein hgh1 [Rhizina undulata]